jgi:hypothetical protein
MSQKIIDCHTLKKRFPPAQNEATARDGGVAFEQADG